MSAGSEESLSALPPTEQSDLLAQALLREYMHRKGYKKTLKQFDIENPRTSMTISSRQLMTNLMALQDIRARNDKRGTPASTEVDGDACGSTKGKSFATFMEVLCSYRLRKRHVRSSHNNNNNNNNNQSLYYDSSDEEGELEKKSAEKQEAIKAGQQDIEDARLRYEERIATKNEKMKIKKVKKGGQVDEDDAKAKKKKDKTSAKKSKKTSSVLASAMNTLNQLPVSSGKTGQGRNWVPTFVPEVGLSSGGSFTSVVDKDATPPSFIAGTGFSLMADRAAKANAPCEEWVAPQERSPSTRRRSSDGGGGEDSDVPSPYRKLGAATYDPKSAPARGGLARKGAGPNALEESPDKDKKMKRTGSGFNLSPIHGNAGETGDTHSPSMSRSSSIGGDENGSTKKSRRRVKIMVDE